MTTYPLRIFRCSSDLAQQALVRQDIYRAQGFDYEELLRRERVIRRLRSNIVTEHAKVSAPASSHSTTIAACSTDDRVLHARSSAPHKAASHAPGSMSDQKSAEAEQSDTRQPGILGTCISSAAPPDSEADVPEALANSQSSAFAPPQESLNALLTPVNGINVLPGCLDVVARELTKFCTDPAIVREGRWTAQITLDRDPLAETTLDVEYSHLELALRFSTENAQSRRLILANSKQLEFALTDIFRACGQTCNIKVSVW